MAIDVNRECSQAGWKALQPSWIAVGLSLVVCPKKQASRSVLLMKPSRGDPCPAMADVEVTTLTTAGVVQGPERG
jgi:hypothetical protein